MMTQEEYFKNVVHPDKEWYSKRASQYRFYHISSRVLIIVFSALTAFIAGQAITEKDLIIAIVSSLVVIITAISELMKFKEQWTEYRSTAERMKKEINLFETSTLPYNSETGFNLFVQNFENIKEKEHQNWRAYITEK